MSIKKENKKKWIIAAVAGVVVIGSGIAAIGANAGKEQTVTVQGTVAMIEKRTIANSISGNGTVETGTQEDVTGGSMGMEVKTIHVQEGDVVSAGDIICVFDTSDQEERIADLQEQIADVEENRVEQNSEYDQQQIDAVSTQQTNLTNLTSDLKEAKSELKEAKAELAAREKKYEDAKKKAEEEDSLLGTGGLSIIDETNLLTQISNQRSVVYSAQSRVDTIQAQIDALLEQDNYVYVDAKEENDKQAEERTNSLKEQIEDYQKQINEATIRAKTAGVVTSVNVTEGTTFTGGVIASIEAMDDFVIEAQIEEYDIPDIEVGMKVLVKTDATREEELEGAVIFVAPRATNSGSSSSAGFSSLISGVDTSSFSNSNGSATYLVKIGLNEPNERLRLGMNAKVSILTEERIDAWSVPYDAVYTREDGTTYVEKVTGKDEKGNILTEEMNVELGIQGTYYIEVISNEIKDGTQILIPDAQGNSSIEELLNMMGADAGI